MRTKHARISHRRGTRTWPDDVTALSVTALSVTALFVTALSVTALFVTAVSLPFDAKLPYPQRLSGAQNRACKVARPRGFQIGVSDVDQKKEPISHSGPNIGLGFGNF